MESKKTTNQESHEEAPKKKAPSKAKARKTTTPKKLTTRKPRATKKTKEEVVEQPIVSEVVTEPVVEEKAENTPVVVEVPQPAQTAETPQQETKSEAKQETKPEAKQDAQQETKSEAKQETQPVRQPAKQWEPRRDFQRQEQKPMPLPNITINNIIELAQAPQRSIILTDQQIQQLTLEEIEQRHQFLEETLARVLDYDVVISDTNIWLELLIGHTSSHSDPRVNARLQFERQLEFISKYIHYRGGRFIMMGETYEEIDRFATMTDPQDHREADFTDNVVCLNAAARLAKRLILAQQRENRLRIDGIGAESHHAAFADPAIIRKVAELFAAGKKVLLLTNDASVAIRSMGICDDLQQYNYITDEEWDETYATIRPMVFTFDDLKLLDFYTRQYHYIQMASGQPWMCHISPKREREQYEVLALNQDAFRMGDKHRGDNLNIEQVKAQPQQQSQKQQSQKQQAQKQQQQQKQQTQKQQQAQKQQQSQKQQQTPASKAEVPEQKSAEQKPVEQKQVEQKPVEQKPVEVPVEKPIEKPAEKSADQPTEQKPKQKSRRKPQNRRKAKGEQQEAEKAVETPSEPSKSVE